MLAELKKPNWLKIRLVHNENFTGLKQMMRSRRLHTVCEEAKCPNLHECWAVHRTATFMILGNTCTRACRFCAVKAGKPTELDLAEPERVADSVMDMGLKHVVVTAVARDDLPDGGARVFSDTVIAIRKKKPDCIIEVLPSDMGGNLKALEILMGSKPDVLNHNVETVKRLSPQVRSKATYERSLEFLRRSKEIDSTVVTKSCMMVGLGEKKEEIFETMDDLRAVQVDIFAVGQYLQPTLRHLPVQKYWHPDEFSELKKAGLEKGFKHCEAGPLVRASYHAQEQFEMSKASTE